MPIFGSACGIRTLGLRLERAITSLLLYVPTYVFRTHRPAHIGLLYLAVLPNVAP